MIIPMKMTKVNKINLKASTIPLDDRIHYLRRMGEWSGGFRRDLLYQSPSVDLLLDLREGECALSIGTHHTVSSSVFYVEDLLSVDFLKIYF